MLKSCGIKIEGRNRRNFFSPAAAFRLFFHRFPTAKTSITGATCSWHLRIPCTSPMRPGNQIPPAPMLGNIKVEDPPPYTHTRTQSFPIKPPWPTSSNPGFVGLRRESQAHMTTAIQWRFSRLCFVFQFQLMRYSLRAQNTPVSAMIHLWGITALRTTDLIWIRIGGYKLIREKEYQALS